MATITLYTAEEAARRAGLSEGTIRAWARRLGVGSRLGRSWAFTDEDIERIGRAAPGVVGNPDWSAHLANLAHSEG
jgi:hypothetical protein